MITWRLSDEPIEEDETDEFRDPEVRKNAIRSLLESVEKLLVKEYS